MAQHSVAELPMYVAPEEVHQANEEWLTRIMERLGATWCRHDSTDLHRLWLAPELLLTQTCGYPLMTQLSYRVCIIGRPQYQTANSSGEQHCSVLLCRSEDQRAGLADIRNSRCVINSHDSNSGMNLLRHSVAQWHRDGRFFASVDVSGAHTESVRRVRNNSADLAAIDCVTYDYLERYAPHQVDGLRIVQRSAPSPTLPYIGSLCLNDDEVQRIRQAMNAALGDLPDVADTLGIREVLPASMDDYKVVLEYRKQAASQGYPVLC